MYKVTIHVPKTAALLTAEQQEWSRVIVRSLCTFMEELPFECVIRSTGNGRRLEPKFWGDGLKSAGSFDQGGILTEHRIGKDGSVTLRVFFGCIKLRDYRVDGNGRRTRYLGFDDWVEFNRLINAWLDNMPFSAEVRSSSFIVRYRDKKRITFTHGDYHGLNDQWQFSGLNHPPFTFTTPPKY